MPSLPPAYPAFSFVSCPHPPAPLPLRGRGIFTFHMQGAPPLASPRLRRRRHGLNLRCRCPLGGLPGWLPADLATVVSAGAACLRCRLPTPPFACFFAPIPPAPLPLRGRGSFKVILCKGLRPLHPRGWAGSGIGFSCGKRVPLVITAVQGDSKPCRLGRGTGEQRRQPRRGGTGGEELRRLRWSSPPGQG